MAVAYKVVARKNPKQPDNPAKFYPCVVTMGQTVTLNEIAYEMKEMSSLSTGDIKSVLSNFVTAMRRALYNGHSVNIADFGVFSLTARTKGEDTKDKVTSKNIERLRIGFRASTSVRPDLNAKNPGDAVTFIDVEKAVSLSSDAGEEDDDEL